MVLEDEKGRGGTDVLDSGHDGAWHGQNCKRVGVGGAKRSRWALQDGSPWATQAIWILSQGHKQGDAKSDMHYP